MPTLVLATGNEHKVREIKQILSDPSIEIKTAKDLGVEDKLREDGNTFEENALQKAHAVHEATGLPTLADDSGLEVYFLNHRPGVLSARYAGDNAGDEENNKKLLKELGPLSFRRRTARFRCIMAFVADGVEEFVSGECRGIILEQLRGTNGFGYDPLFKPDGYDKTFGEMEPEEKQTISHRSRALQKMKPVLENYFAGVG
jgi:non-canonical purine NTP pyrophosphatase (RdgB/HAM1 family)